MDILITLAVLLMLNGGTMPGRINPVGGVQQRTFGNTPGQGFRGQPTSTPFANYGVGWFPAHPRARSQNPQMPTFQKQWGGNNFINPLSQATQRPQTGNGWTPSGNVPNIYQPPSGYTPSGNTPPPPDVYTPYVETPYTRSGNIPNVPQPPSGYR